MKVTNPTGTESQYSLKKILVIWVLSALPMGLLALVVAPQVVWLTQWPPLIIYWLSVITGLVWQFILCLLILKHDGHPLNISTFKSRLKYQPPVNPKNGRSSYWLLLWTIPFIALSALLQSNALQLPDVDHWITPLLSCVTVYDMSTLANPEYKGAWWILGLFLITALFNYLLGEELMYRGILLPKMKGVFGKWDWLANGVLFGFYHLHKPQVILSTALYFGLVFALPSRLFQSSWMAFIIHGLEGILGLIIVLGIILGVNS